MARNVREELRQADRELHRFFRYQWTEAHRLGYPRQATFARDIARGTIGTPPPTGEDPAMECVGQFYWELGEIERRIVAEKYLETGTEYERAKRVGITVRQLRVKMDRILLQCSGWIMRFESDRRKLAA